MLDGITTTHNDTKLNNVLIDDLSGNGICVIDLDTGIPFVQPITLLERGRGVGLDERNAGTIRETCQLMEK
jgi:hypothetical protein